MTSLLALCMCVLSRKLKREVYSMWSHWEEEKRD